MTNAKLSSGAQVNLNLSLVTEALYHFNLNGDASNPLLAQKLLMTVVISSMMVAHDKMTYCQRQVSCLCYIGLHNKAQQTLKISRNLPIIKFVKCLCIDFKIASEYLLKNCESHSNVIYKSNKNVHNFIVGHICTTVQIISIGYSGKRHSGKNPSHHYAKKSMIFYSD